MITRVILYEQVGLVICKNDKGFQAPSLGGKFQDVIDKVLDAVQKEEIKWLLVDGTSEKAVPFEEWMARGRVISGCDPVIPVKELDIITLQGRSTPLGEDMTPRPDLT